MINMRKLLTTIGTAAILLLIVVMSSPDAADASATRDLPDPCVDPNAEFTVAISVSGANTFSEVAETLCDGWTYTGSSLADSQVTVDGNTVKFYSLGSDASYTYTVQAPSTEGNCCTISGTLRDTSQSTSSVGGGSQVCVCEGDATTPSATTVESPDGGESTGDVVTTPVATPTETGTQPVAGETVTSAPSVTPIESMTPVATSTKKLATKPDAAGMVPGFGALFAVAGLLAVAYMFRRR